MKGLIVIGRDNHRDRTLYPGGSNNKCAISISIHEVLSNYRGVEGVLWPRQELLGEKYNNICVLSIDEIGYVRSYLEGVTFNGKVDVIYIVAGNDSIVKSIDIPWPFLGYDYGYIDEYGSYSIIYNEILYGHYKDMREYASCLNTNMLFDAIPDILKLKHTREVLLKKGAVNLETSPTPEEMFHIGIYDISKFSVELVRDL